MIDLSMHPKLEKFRKFNKDELSRLDIQHYAPGKFLIQEDRPKDMSLFLLLKGICIADKLKPGEDHYFSTYRVLPGEFIGLYEIISPDQIKRSISICAKTLVTTLCIEGTEYLRWQTAHPDLYNWVISEVLANRYRAYILQVNAVRLNTYNAGAYYLHNLYIEYRDACYSPAYSGSVKIWDTRSEIGNALALDVRSVDRIINKFHHLDMLSVMKGKVHIDKKQDHKLSDFLDS